MTREWPMCERERCHRIPTSEDHEEACKAYWDAVDAWHEAEKLLEVARSLYPAYEASGRERTPEERARYEARS